MTDETAAKPAESTPKVNGRPFKKGYDERRWLNGRGKKSADQKKGEEILRAVIWDELSREFDAKNGKALDEPETLDAMRLMVRTAIKKDWRSVMERIAGKVTEKHDLTNSDGSLIPKEENIERFDRAISTLADALREVVSGKGAKQNGEVDTPK